MTRHIWSTNDRLDTADLNGSFASLIALNGVRVTRASAQTITTATLTAIAFDSEVSDDGGFHSNVTNNTRLTVPLAGWYDFGFSLAFTANATGFRQVLIRVNAGNYILAATHPTPSAGVESQMVGSGARYFAVSDYIECMVNQTSGGNLNVIQTAEYSPVFWMAARRGS